MNIYNGKRFTNFLTSKYSPIIAVTAYEFRMSFEGKSEPKMQVEVNGDKTYDIGNSLTMVELDDALQTWKKHCIT